MLRLLYIRVKQLFRFGKELGIFRSLIVLFFISFVYFAEFSLILNKSRTIFTFFVILLSVLFIHLKRVDKKFLQNIFINSGFYIFIEYAILMIPLIIAFALSDFWYLSIVLLFGLSFISSMQKSYSFKLKGNSIKIPYISILDYEWISGLRINIYYYVFVLIVGLALSVFEYTVPITILFNSLIVSSFYIYTEPKEFIEISALKPHQFVLKKTFRHLRLFILLNSLFLPVYLIVHYSTWYLLILSFIGSFAIIFFSIILKYAFYSPNQRLGFNYFLIAIFSITLIFPFFQIISIYLIILYYKKAMFNLKQYLYVQY